MARGSGGTYTLPSSPVVSGTTVASAVENAFRSDVAAEITDSLSRSGKGPMTAPLELANGTVSLPALTFDSDPDTGLYRVGAGELGIAADGVKVAGITVTTVTLPKGVTATQSTTNASAVTATGNGTGYGVNATGGATAAGHGVNAIGGAGGGAGGNFTGTAAYQGIAGTGGPTNGTGGTFKGTGSNAIGVSAIGDGDGTAGYFDNSGETGYGIVSKGNASRAPLYLEPQGTAPTALDKGAIYMNTDGKLYVCNGAAWVVVGGQS
jgi:hypothetical protein